MRKHLLAIAVMLTAATGCDNVAWGGMQMELKPPPESLRTPAEEEDSTGASGPTNIDGPILLAGVRDSTRAHLVLVGEVLPEGLRAFPDTTFPDDAVRLAEATAIGSEWILFSNGVRVGRMTVDEAVPATDYCGSRTDLSGIVELVPTAAAATRFFAMPASDARSAAYGTFEPMADDFDQRVASLNIGGELIRRYEAVWPADTLRYARHDIQAFRLGDLTRPFVAATFLHQDAMAVRNPRQGAYSLFLMAQQGQNGRYAEAYNWYRVAGTEGKGAPRFFDHLDVDGDGSEEILLEVLGAQSRWFALLSRREGSWVRTYQDACGSGSPSN